MLPLREGERDDSSGELPGWMGRETRRRGSVVVVLPVGREAGMEEPMEGGGKCEESETKATPAS